MELSVSSHLLNSSSSSSQLPKTRVRVSHNTLIPFGFQQQQQQQQPPLSSTHLRRSLSPMDAHRRTITRASIVQDNGSPPTSSPINIGARIGEVKRVTKETNVSVRINLDGSGVADSSTGIPFLDHMLDQLASHGLFDMHVKATGDIHIDDHHTNEDVALAIGTDLSGRPHLSYDLRIPTQRVGTYDTQLVEHFFQSLVNTSGMTLHIRQLAGKNSHHIIEATFKAFARALRQATDFVLRRHGSVPRGSVAYLILLDHQTKVDHYNHKLKLFIRTVPLRYCKNELI
ncbi:hypothetical protein LOK49_LG08G02970 [Camellia lanceoleosa]|uniref:Uncharacterized protein n=1 Tax=Camellia lanceoleosa TaxID=1840588 RepID=A0ACC0GPZ4_9ERIC|nr:hypothetical protein LOK49_LG08G02970 [Camellia lanceoleosa]